MPRRRRRRTSRVKMGSSSPATRGATAPRARSRGPSAPGMPSIRPSRARASTSRSRPSCRTPWACSELTITRGVACEPAQVAARHQVHLVRRRVLLLERLRLVLAVIRHARHVLHLLPQRAAERDVHLLEAAADGEQRQARFDRARDQRQRRRIPMRVVQRVRIARRPGVSRRLDVRRAARQQDAVEPLERLVEVRQRRAPESARASRRRLPPPRRCTSPPRNGRGAGRGSGDPRECRSEVCGEARLRS